jgi:hypothetical protein
MQAMGRSFSAFAFSEGIETIIAGKPYYSCSMAIMALSDFERFLSMCLFYPSPLYRKAYTVIGKACIKKQI